MGIWWSGQAAHPVEISMGAWGSKFQPSVLACLTQTSGATHLHLCDMGAGCAGYQFSKKDLPACAESADSST